MAASSAVIAVERSDNRKLGGCSVTYVSQASCPPSCPLFHEGCYAEHGPTGMITRRLGHSATVQPARIAQAEAKAIDSLTGDRLLRLHAVGDCRTARAAQLVGAAATRYALRGSCRPASGRKVWTYTHAWQAVPRGAWGEAVSVLASVESVPDAEQAMERGYAAAILVPSFTATKTYQLHGVKVIPCPEQTKAVKCNECRLCLDDERLRRERLTIGFQAHGSQAGRIVRRLSLHTIERGVSNE